MRMQVSTIALAAALLASPQIAHAQLAGVDISTDGGGLGVDVSIGVSDGIGVSSGVGSSGVDANVNAGGSSGVDVDAGIGVDGGSGLDVDASVGIGGSDGIGVDANVGVGGSSGIDAGASVGVGRSNGALGVGPNGGTLIDLDADVDIGGGSVSGNTPRTQQASQAPLIGTGISLSALSDTARVDAIADLLSDASLADIDLDAVVDDRNVSILFANDLLGDGGLGQLLDRLDENVDGRQSILEAVSSSNVLSSVLGNQGIDLEDVVALQVRGDGATEILVLREVAQVAIGGSTTEAVDQTQPTSDGLLGRSLGEMAELDISLLSDEEVGLIDLSLLPREDQRLAAVLRLLATDDASSAGADGVGSEGGTVRILDIGAFLDNASIAQVDAVLGDGGDVQLDADLLSQLEELGLPAGTVLGVNLAEDGTAVVLVDAMRSSTEDGADQSTLASVDLDIGSAADSDVGEGPDDTNGSDNGTEVGTEEPDGAGNGGDSGNEATGTEGTDDASVETAADDDAGAVDGGSTDTDAEDANSEGDTTTGAVASATAVLTTNPVAGISYPAAPQLFAQLGCNAGTAALSSGEVASPAQIAQASSLELVQVVGCAGTLPTQDIESIRRSIEANDELDRVLQDVGVSTDQVIGAKASEDIVTVFVERPEA